MDISSYDLIASEFYDYLMQLMGQGPDIIDLNLFSFIDALKISFGPNHCFSPEEMKSWATIAELCIHIYTFDMGSGICCNWFVALIEKEIVNCCRIQLEVLFSTAHR